MKKETEGLRFTHLEIENFKSIEKKVIDIDGRSLLITGPNGAGKSSFIQALLSGIDPKQQPTESIKKGETKASVKVKIAGTLHGEAKEFCIDMYYTPKNKKGRIVVTNHLGEAVKSPKTILDSVIGNISFDIFKFINDSKEKQIKVLKDLSGVSVQIDTLNMERSKIMDSRKLLKSKVEENEALMGNHGFTQDEIDVYSTPIDMAPIQEELTGISKKITGYNGVKTKTEQFAKDALQHDKNVENHIKSINTLEAEMRVLQNKITATREEITIEQSLGAAAFENNKKGLAWLENNAEPSAEEISKRITSATEHNTKHEKINQLVEKQKALHADKNIIISQTDKLNDIDVQKINIISNSKLPIKGLTFTDDEIYLDNLPFDAEQINTQKLIEVGVEISMALNPGLRVIFLREGSLFDQKNLDAFIKKCEARGYQIIAELVSNTQSDLSITFTESQE